MIFDIHENTDLQILEKDWIPFIFRKIIATIYSAYENYACTKFDFLIVPQESMFDKFDTFQKTSVIGNFPNKIKKPYFDSKKIDKYSLLYSGSVTESRGLINMLNLINVLVKLDKRYILTIAGSMDAKLLEKAKKHDGWLYTNYLGHLSKDEIYEVYSQNSIGLILFNNVGQYYMAYSLKLFEYMQNGMFVIMPNFGDWIKFNKNYNVGNNVPTNNYKETSGIIHNLNNEGLIKYANDNIKSVNDNFSWESQEIKLFKLYKELINFN